jgi:rare lipoprotein A
VKAWRPFYGQEFQAKTTASGTRFDMRSLVAAHPTYPFGTIVRVTNLDNGRQVQVRIVDRGPAPSARAAGVLIDLSYRGAETLRFIREGRARVRLEVLSWGDKSQP